MKRKKKKAILKAYSNLGFNYNEREEGRILSWHHSSKQSVALPVPSGKRNSLPSHEIF